MDQLREIGCGLLSVLWAVHDNGLVSASLDPFQSRGCTRALNGMLTAPAL
jgi:hypothetical protein